MDMFGKRLDPAPVKVHGDTKEQIRLAATLLETTQAEVVGLAMSEFVERHAEDIAHGLKHAREALHAGQIETIAYLLDEDPEAVRRVSGSDPVPTPLPRTHTDEPSPTSPAPAR